MSRCFAAALMVVVCLPARAGADLEPAIQRGVDYLVHSQNPDGSWGSAHNTKDLNVMAPVPGAHHAFRAAVTALCVQSLIETGAADKHAAAAAALAKGETWLLERLAQLRRADEITLYNVWGHAYGIQALVALHRRPGASADRQRQYRDIIAGQIELLQRYESVDGGWGYYDFRVGAKQPSVHSTSFVSATVLLALADARQIGIAIPESITKRGFDSIQRQRKSDNTYLYGEYLKWHPMQPINRPAGSLGRSQACNLALRAWGDKTITDAVLEEWLTRLAARNEWLSFARKRPVPHESWFSVAGYFYYYGHYYAARCLNELPAANRRPHQTSLAGILLPLQEKDGSWWDFPLYDYHQPYGTAFALMSLVRCRAGS